MAAFVLVHSPLTGPQAWSRVAEELGAQGHATAVPALPPALASPLPIWKTQAQAAVDAALALGTRSPVLVAHSGAGPLLPCIRQLGAPAGGYLFVDAALPEPDRSRLETLPEELRQVLLGMVSEGVIPSWPSWWGPGALAQLIEDRALREEFAAGCPPLPLALFSEPLPVLDGWPDAPCGYLRLSAAYVAEAQEARRRGWPCLELEGQHLDILTRPAEVSAALQELVARMGIV